MLTKHDKIIKDSLYRVANKLYSEIDEFNIGEMLPEVDALMYIKKHYKNQSAARINK